MKISSNGTSLSQQSFTRFDSGLVLSSLRQSACNDLASQCRAASIDRGIFLEAAVAGLRTREVDGTRKAVPGGLEGAVYEVSSLSLLKSSCGGPSRPQWQALKC